MYSGAMVTSPRPERSEPPLPKTRAQRQAETRDKLLDAALVVFVESGFHGASVEAIARQAGYTKGAVYANFAGKDELFLAVIDRRIDRNLQAQSEFAEAAARGEDVSADLASFFEQQFDRDWAILAFEALLYAAREGPELMEAIAERYRQIDALGLQFLQKNAPGPADRLKYLAIGQSALGEGLMLRHLVEPDRITHEVIDKIYDAIFASPDQAEGGEKAPAEPAADD